MGAVESLYVFEDEVSGIIGDFSRARSTWNGAVTTWDALCTLIVLQTY